MSVNPYSTPLKTEYKPLGLEAFAEPLSKMQAKFDTVKSEIEASDFGIERLDQDDPRAKSLVEEIQSKRDSLAENLLKTGNYREAQQKLMQLNRTFHKDEETTAIRSNYQAYKEAATKQKERVEKGDITQKDFDLWDFKARTSFGGTKFDSKTGNYNSIAVKPRTKNMEKELREESLKLAGMIKTQGVESFGEWDKMDPLRQERIKYALDYIDLDQAAAEIESFLRTSEQYKDWNRETADYEWYYNSKNNPNFALEFLETANQNIDASIAHYAELAKKPEHKEEATKYLNRLTKDKAEFETNLKSSLNDGSYEDYAQQLFMQSRDGKIGQIGRAAADLIDFSRQGLTSTIQEDPYLKGRVTKAQTDLDEIGEITSNIVNYSGDENLITTGAATADYDEMQSINSKKLAFESLQVAKIETTPKLEDYSTIEQNLPDGQGKEDLKKVGTSLKDYHVSLYRFNDLNKVVETRALQIEDLTNKLGKAKSEEERTMIKSEIESLHKSNVATKITMGNDINLFENIIDDYISTRDYVTPEMKTLWNTKHKGKGFAGTTDFLDYLRKEEQKRYDDFASKVKPIIDGKNAQAMDAVGKVPLVPFTYDETGKVIEKPGLENSYIPGEFENVVPVPTAQHEMLNVAARNGMGARTPEQQLAEEVMGAYKENIKTAFYAVGQEITYSKGADKFTGGALGELVNATKQQEGGKSSALRVEYNATKGTTKEMVGSKDFILKAYNSEPTYVGVDQNGNSIFRYTRVRDLDPNSPNIKTYVAGLKGEEKAVPSEAEVKEFLNANPKDLYLTTGGSSRNPIRSAQEKYIEIGESAGMANSPEMIYKNLQNYAKFHIIQSPETKSAYQGMAAKIRDAVEEKHKFTEFTQAPAVWNPNPDGSHTGFSIRYKVVNGEVYADVFKGVLVNGDATWGQAPVATKQLSSEFQNLPTALAAMDLLYGTGREADLPRKWDNSPYVPAFNMPQMVGR